MNYWTLLEWQLFETLLESINSYVLNAETIYLCRLFTLDSKLIFHFLSMLSCASQDLTFQNSVFNVCDQLFEILSWTFHRKSVISRQVLAHTTLRFLHQTVEQTSRVLILMYNTYYSMSIKNKTGYRKKVSHTPIITENHLLTMFSALTLNFL